MWGPGFENYNDRLSLRNNLLNRFGSIYFDITVVWIWSMNDEIKEISNETAVLVMEDENWCDPTKTIECTSDKFDSYLNATLMARSYAVDMLLPQNLLHQSHGVIFHLPKTVAAEHFYAPPDTPRDIDVFVVGAQHQYVYPVRWKLAQLVNNTNFKAKWNVTFYKHPGYWERGSEDIIHFNDTMNQIKTYAKLMQRSKIVITDASRYGYAVGKYAEIPASGALLLGDVPLEREDDFEQFVVAIHQKDTYEKALSKIEFWLTNATARLQRAKLGQDITLHKYTNDHSIDIILQAYQRLVQKRYGHFFPFSYSLACRALSPVHWSSECIPPPLGWDPNIMASQWHTE